MGAWIDIATRFGVPTAILIIVLIYHAKVVEKKDAELARVNELRVGESKAVSDKMIEHDNSAQATLHGLDKTMQQLIDRIR